MGIVHGLVGVVDYFYQAAVFCFAAGVQVIEVGIHLFGLYFGVVHPQFGLLVQQVVGYVYGGTLAGVVGVFFKGPAKDGDLFAAYGIEELAYDVLGKAALLVVVHFDDLLPVVGDFGEAVTAGNVHQVEDVFLETAAAEAYGGFQELGADAAVLAYGAGYFIYVGTALFAEGRDGVDGRYALGQEGIGGEFGEFGRPYIGGDDALAIDPARVDVHKGLYGGLTGFVLSPANEHAVGLVQVLYGGAFGQKLGIGEHLKLQAFVFGIQYGAYALGGAYGQGRFLDHYLVAGGYPGYLSGAELYVF